jgi:hypothetical protein
MGRLVRALGAIAVVTVMALVPGLANASVLINVTQSGGNVDVTATGSLDLTGATFNHAQPYNTGIIPGSSNWYVALGATPGMDWYDLTSVMLPYGTSGTFFTSSTTSGDAISIWGFGGGQPQVGVSTGYTSGTAISADMTIAGETIAGMTLIPGTYTFTIPNDTIVLQIAGTTSTPEPSTLTMMLSSLGAFGLAGYRRLRKA